MASSKKIFSHNGVTMLPARRAAKRLDVAPDYIGKLCRDGKLECLREDNSWFVAERSLAAFEKQRESSRQERAQDLAAQRRSEQETYRKTLMPLPVPRQASAKPELSALLQKLSAAHVRAAAATLGVLLFVATAALAGAHIVPARLSLETNSADLSAALAQIRSPFFSTAVAPVSLEARAEGRIAQLIAMLAGIFSAGEDRYAHVPQLEVPAAATTAAATTTIVNQYNTYPIAERVVVERAATQGDWVSADALTLILAEMHRSLRADITRIVGDSIEGSVRSISSGGGGLSLSDLIDANIPDTITASNYLPLIGGTLTGALQNTSTATSTFTGGIAAERFDATSTSTFAGIRIVGLDCSIFNNDGKLTTDASGNIICDDDTSGAGAGVPGGANTQVQYNDGGNFGGDAGFTYNETADRLTVTYASTTGITASYASTTALVAGSLSLNGSAFTSLLGAGLANVGGVLTVDDAAFLSLSDYFASTSPEHITSLPNLSITESQISDLGNYLTDAVTAIGPAGQTQTGPTVTIATSSDTNIGLTVTGAGNTLTFTSTWTGTLADARVADNLTISGGTINSTPIGATTPSTGVFTLATTTSATTTNLAITGLTNALLATNANGSVIATTSVGANYITGLLGTINGTNFNRGDSITVTAASSTLLTDSNTFSGANTFSGNVTLAGATSSSFAITGITSSLLKTNANGSVVPAIAGTDYLTAASIFDYPFPNNATSTTLTFSNGFLSTASSTLQNFTFLNATGTAATTSSFAVTGSATFNDASVSGDLSLNLLDGCVEVAGGILTSTGSNCGTGSGGITSLNGLTASSQSFATSSDTNIGLTITSSGSVHTFTSTWTGTLADARVADNLTISGGTIDNTPIGATTPSTAVFTNATATNATTTNFFATTASSTNLFSSAAQFGSITVAGSSFTSLLGTGLTNSSGSLTVDFSAFDTDDLQEGSANFYFTQTRFDNALSATTSVDSITTLQNLSITASQVSDFSAAADARVAAGTTTIRGMLSASTPLQYNSGTGAFSILQSGAAQDGYLSSTDWNTFNEKVSSSSLASFIEDGRDWQISNGALTPTTTLGILVTASSTIGNGTQAGGLTVSGGATTTGTLAVLGTGTSTFGGGLSVSGSIVPTADDTYSLGSASLMWRDVYIGPGSLYVNGKKVIEDDSDIITISTDDDKNLRVQTDGSGNVSVRALGTGNANFTTGSGNINITSTSGNVNVGTTGSGLLSLGTVTTGVWHGTDVDISDYTNLAVSYPITLTGDTLGLAFSTSTSNTWEGTQTFANIIATNATTTNLAITGLTNALLATNVNGSVIATTSVGANYITGLLGTINGEAFNRGDSITVTAASSTLLTDNNTFSGANTFSGNVTLAGATSSSFAITGITSSLLKTNANGSVVPAIAGTDYLTAASIFDYPFPNNATSTTLTFSNGFLSTASSTLQNFTFLNATGTSATTTNLAITGIVSSLLKTNANGSVVPAIVGTDYLTTAVTSLGPVGQTADGPTVTFATSSDTNIGLTITGSGDTISFASTWTGTLADARVDDNLTVSGGTINSTPIGASSASTAIFTNATSTNFEVLGAASTTAFYGAGLGECSDAADKLVWDGGLFACETDAGAGGGITQIGPAGQIQTGPAIVLATSTSAFNGLTSNLVITGTGNTLTFTSSLSGSLGDAGVDNNLTVSGGTIDNTPIGASTPSTGTFTSFTAANATTTTLAVTNIASTSALVVSGSANTRTLTIAGLSGGGAQCLQVDSSGAVSATGVGCGTGSGDSQWELYNGVGVRLATSTNRVIIGAEATSSLAQLEVITAQTMAAYFSGTVGIGTSTPSALLALHARAGEANRLLFAIASSTASATTTHFAVTNTGSVGIGTSTPWAKLSVVGGNISQVAAGNPTLATSTGTVGNANDVYVSGGLAYVAAGSSGLRIYDVSNPASPQFLGSYTGISNTQTVAVSGRYAYAVDSTAGLVVLDVSDMSAPTRVGGLAFTNSYSIALSGRYAYVASYNDAVVRIIDIANPASPRLVGSYSASGSARSVAISGRYAYVAATDAAVIDIVDISNPASPVQVDTYSHSTVEFPWGVHVSGGYLYVSDLTQGFSIVDISDPDTASFVGSYTSGSSIHVDSMVAGGYAYVLDDSGELAVLNVSNPASPSLVGVYDTTTISGNVFVSGKHAYVAAGNGGMHVVDINGAELPAANIGSLAANTGNFADSLNVGQNIFAGGGLSVGLSGINSRGDIAGAGNAAFGGRLGVGTTSPAARLAIHANTGDAYAQNLFLIASSTASATTTLFSINSAGLATLTNLLVSGSSTLQNFTAQQGTTTALAITSLTSTLLKTNANGSIVPAIAGVDYSNYSWPFPNNATSTTLTFAGGLVSVGSTTISGSATTTGDLYAGTLRVGTTTAGNVLAVDGSVSLNDLFRIEDVDSCGTFSRAFVGPVGTVGGDKCAALNVTQLDTNGNVIYRFGQVNAAWAGEFYANATLVGLNTKTDVPILFQVEGQEKMRISGSTGNVGIGTTSPLAKLSVGGSTYLGGDLTATGSVQFTNLTGGALAADASGTLYTFSTSTWAFASSTLLSDDNTFSGANNFSGNVTLAGATSSSFAITGITSSLLKTDANGSIVPAILGTDYQNFGYLFPNNATSTTLTFSNGLLSTASTTIGNGTQAGGLTVNGGATTTGNQYVGGALTVIGNFDLKNTLRNVGSNVEVYGGEFTVSGGDATISGGNLDVSGGDITASGGNIIASFNVGIGTTTPYARLSVEGNSALGNSALAGYFIATTTTASVLPYASSTAITVAGLADINTLALNLADGCAEIVDGIVTSTGSNCGTGSGGITSLNGLTNASQTFATTSDTNVGLTITSSGSTHTFTSTWTGTLADARVADNLTLSGGAIDNTPIGATTPSTGVFTLATTTSATTTNLAITGITSSLLATNANGSVIATTSIGTNLLTGLLGTINGTNFNRGDSITVTAASSTLLSDSNTFSGANSFSGNVTLANATSTSLYTTTLGINSEYFTDLTGTGLTISGTALTVDDTAFLSLANYFASTSPEHITSLPNLTITESQISDLDHYTNDDANAFIHASTTIPKTYTANTFTALQTFSNFLATGSTTLQNFTFLNATGTSATTTNLAISGITSSLLKTNANGSVIPAIAGTDYLTAANIFAWPFPNNATSTTLTFNNGLLSLASTTIGDGTQAGGLTISGGATSTLKFTSIGNISFPGTSEQKIGFGDTANRLTFGGNSPDTVGQSIVGAYFSVFGRSHSPTTFTPGGGAEFVIDATNGTTEFNVIRHASSAWTSLFAINSNGGASIGTIFSNGTAPPSDGLLVQGNVGIGTTTPLTKLSVYGTGRFQTPTNSATAFEIWNAASTSVFTVATDGFGTTTLSGLTINGSATSTSNVGFNLTDGCFAIDGACLSDSTASSTLLTDSNTFSGANSFSGNVTLAGATSSSFAITGITSSLLKTNANGSIVPAILGTDYQNFAYPFPSNATSTTLTFSNGLLATGSSTVGGLTVQGFTFGATTTTSILGRFGTASFIVASSTGLNTALGMNALDSVTGGSNNTAVGYNTLTANTSGTDNAALGYNALSANTSGINNVAIGSGALSSASGSFNNIAIGYQSLSSASLSGDQNIGIGTNALLALTSGSGNTGLGHFALTANTSGFNNTALGYGVLDSNTTGHSNSGVGSQALSANTLGFQNAALGNSALSANTTGSQNTALGQSAGGNITTGSGNIAIGWNAVLPSATADRQLNIGNLIFGTLPATSSASTLSLPTSGALGIGTSSPFATLSVHANNGSTNTTLFAIGSSTASATTTLFSISNTGSTTIANGVNIEAGCYAVGGVCIDLSGAYGDINTNAFIHGSTTIPKTYTANTFTGAQTFNGGVTIGSLTGPLQAINGTVSATSTLSVAYGGTGLSTAPTLGQLLVGNASGGYTLTATSSLGIVLADTTGTLGVSRGGTGAVTFTDNRILTGNGTSAIVDEANLTFNGSLLTVTGTGRISTAVQVGTGGSYESALHVNMQDVPNSPHASSLLTLEHNSQDVSLSLFTNSSYDGAIYFARSDNNDIGRIIYDHGTDSLLLGANYSTNQLVLASNGRVGIGTSSPLAALSVAGSAYIGGNLTATGTVQFTNLTGGALATDASGTLYTFSTSTWSFASSTLLSDNNTWTGINTFSENVTFTTTGGNEILNIDSLIGTFTYTPDGVFSGATVVDFGNNDVAVTNNSNFFLVNPLAADSTSRIFAVREGTGQYSFVVDGDGRAGVGTSSPYANLTVWGSSSGNIFEVVTSASSTALSVSATGFGTTTLSGLNINGSATSTSNVGINLSGGCFAINGTCITGSGSGSGDPFAFTPTAHFGTTTNATSTPLWLRGSQFSLFASSSALFENIQIGTTTATTVPLAIDRTYSSAASSRVGGIDQSLTYNMTGGGTQIGNNLYIYNSPQTNADTLVGSFIRVEDNTALSNTVRGLEVQTNRGTNTQGTNTAISGTGRTFGVRAITEGDAGGVVIPAAVFAQTRGTTQGNAIRAYSSTVTTADALLSIVHDTSAFSGTGILANLAAGSGSFTGNLLDLQINDVSYFTVASTGTTTISNGVNITDGCFAVDGVCISTSGSSITFGTDNQVPFTNSGGTDYDYSASFTFDGSVLSVPKVNVTAATSSVLTLNGADLLTASSTNSSLTLGLGAAPGLTATALRNVAIGAFALQNATSTDDNIAIGSGALTGGASLNTGLKQIAIGTQALFSVTSGTDNTAIGYQNLALTTTGSWNVALGNNALRNTSSGSANVGIGYFALNANTTGASSTATGYAALQANTTGALNTGFGYVALGSNTTGSGNTALGTQALAANTVNGNSTAVGYAALNVATGAESTALGAGALIGNTSGYGNIGVGYFAGQNLTTGDGSIAIGNNTFFPSASADRQLNIGGLIFGTLPATSTGFALPTSGALGIASSSPFATFSVHANNGSTNTTLFAIGSSTASATTTLFSISNTGSTTIANGINIEAGCYAINGACIGGSSGITSIGPAGQGQTGSSITFASSTTGTDFTITATGNTITFNLPSASSANRGLLTATDWGIFNNKISSSSIDTSAELAALLGDETGSGLAVFGTSPTFAGTPVFSGGLINYSVVSTSTIPDNEPYAWTIATSSTGAPLFRIDTTAGAESIVLGGAGDDILIGDIGAPANLVFEESASINGQGGNTLTFGQSGDKLYFAVNTGFGTSTAYAPLTAWATSTSDRIFEVVTSASTTALSVSATGFGTTTVTGLNINGSATTTSNVGINLSGGCFAINGTCISGGGSSVSFGTDNQIPFTNSGGTDFDYSSSLTFDGTRLSVGSSSPFATLSVHTNNGSTNTTLFAIGSSTASATTTLFKVSNTGVIDINPTGSDIITRNGVQLLYSDDQGGFSNFGIGHRALEAVTPIVFSGQGNTAVGYYSLASSTTGSFNTAVGSFALWSNTTAEGNTALGNSALSLNTTGGSNTAVGYGALSSNITGRDNVAVGGYRQGDLSFVSTLEANTTGSQNIALGIAAGRNITTGSGNIALGFNALLPSATADRQLSIGNFIFGTLPATTSAAALSLPTSGALGIATTSPFATLSIHANNGSTNTTLFAVGSSTASATTTLFSISNTGSTTIANGVNITDGCYAIDGVCLSVGGGGSGTVNAGTLGQVAYYAGNGTAVSGTSTLTFDTSGRVGIGTSTPYASLSVWGKSTAGTFFEVVNSASSTLFSIAGDALGGTIFNTRRATTTVPDNEPYAWTIATSSTGAPLFRIDTTGGAEAVSIGSPGGDVYIGGVGSASNLVFEESSTIHGQGGNTLTFGQSGDIINFAVNTGFGSSTPSAKLSVHALNGEANRLLFAVASSTASATTTHFAITNAGNIGIGTANPSYALDVAGFVNVDQFSGYKQAGATILYASSSRQSIFVGQNAGDSVTSASSYNTLVGYNSGTNITSGAHNLVLGSFSTAANSNITTGSNNISIGYNISMPSATANNQLNIGNILYGTSIDGSALTPSTGRIGIGTSSPYARLSVHANNGEINTTLFAIGSSTASATTTLFSISNTGLAYLFGSLGIGTTSAGNKLSVTDTGTQVAIAYDATRFATLQVNSVGDLVLKAQGQDAFFNDDNLWVCTGGSCPSGSPAGTGNLIVENNVGIGTSTPDALLTIEGQNGTDTLLQVATTTNQDIFVIDAGGYVGIGTSTPSEQLSISDLLFVGAGGETDLGQATSTFYGDIRIVGKLDVGTIDPVYTIDGVKYATYGHSTIGIKEEVVTALRVDELGEDGKYRSTIRFSELEEGSDLWLFYQVTAFGEEWEKLVISLTPGFEGTVSYQKEPGENALTIVSSQPGEVSMRLIADRFDAGKWPNLRPDQDDPYTNFELQSKK